jgi:membrane protease YdiL (CAAX protease family)
MCNLHIYLMSLPALPAHLIAAPSTSTRRAAAGLLVITLAGACAMAPTHVLWLLVVTPVLEEIVFRAGLQEELLRQARLRVAMGAVSANLLTALAFGVAHMALSPGLLAGLTVLPALLIGAVYQRQRRVVPCIALHALFNAIWLLSAGVSN